MKKNIIRIVAALCVLSMLFACGQTDIEDLGITTSFKEYDPEGAVQEICTVGGTTLYLNPGSMEISLESEDGWEWSSYDFYNSGASSAAQSFSLFQIKCATIGGEQTTLDSYLDCIKKKQYNVSLIDNGFSVTFVAGKVSKDRALPEIAPKEDFEGWISQIEALSKRVSKQIQLAYSFFTYDDNPDKVKDYPQLGTYKDGIYVMKNDVTDREKEIWEEYFEQIGITQEYVSELHESLNYTPQSKNNPVVQFVLNVTLDSNGDLIVEMPTNSFIFDSDSYVINSISIMESLCANEAGSKSDDSKYIFFPDGSGVVAETNSVTGEGLLSGTVYNSVTDKLGSYYYNSVYGYENIYMPVFGFAREKVAAFAIIESGGEATNITANYTNSKIISAYPTFMFEDYTTSRIDEMVSLSEAYSLNPDFVYRVRYKFIPGDDVSYIDMAKTYREYLIENGLLSDVDENLELTYYLETLGYVRASEESSFITVKKDKVLTSYQDDIDMINALAAGGVDSLALKLTGWSNGGISNEYTTKIEHSKEMGGQDGWDSLVDCVAQNNVEFYPNVNFMTVGAVSSFDGFSPKSMAIRNSYNSYNGIGVYIQANKNTAGFSYIINPAKIMKGITKFLDKSSEYISTGVSVDYMGSVLVKDYKSGNRMTRTDSVGYITEALETISDAAPLMLKSANQYAWKYADVLLDMPTTSAEDTSTQTVPFLQMVLHGSKATTGAAINTCSSYEDAVLESILFAQSVYFTMAKQNLIYLKESEFSYYYSVDASYWLDVSIDAYKTVKNTVGDCYNCTIENYEKLADDVYKTTFSNGKWVIVNFGRSDADIKIYDESAESAAEDLSDETTAEEAEVSEPVLLESYYVLSKGYLTSDGKEGTVIE